MFFGALIRLQPETTVLLVLLLSAPSEMKVFDLPPANATLNGLSACLIATHFEELKSGVGRGSVRAGTS